MTLITPKKQYQRTSGLRSLSSSLVTILNPVIATSLFAFGGMDAVIYVDLATFGVAFAALLLFVRIPETVKENGTESFSESVKAGLGYLRNNRMILILILFLAGVNLVASAFDAALPAPRNRIRVIYVTMLISLSTENFLLAFAGSPILWCLGQMIGWLLVPVMNANLDVILRATIPETMQGRVYSCRNTLQFFTIPIGFFLGGYMVDELCEPVMQKASAGSVLLLFGSGKGSGAAMAMLILGVTGTLVCLFFGKILRKYRFEEDI